jgi:hypothetical protein
VVRCRCGCGHLDALQRPDDRYLSLRALAAYAGLSVRRLRDYLVDPASPLPHYRVGGKILVKRSEFDAWIRVFRAAERPGLEEIVAEVLRSL